MTWHGLFFLRPEYPCWHLTHVLLACIRMPILKQKGYYTLFQVILPTRPGLSRWQAHFARLKGSWAIIPNKLTSPQEIDTILTQLLFPCGPNLARFDKGSRLKC